LKNYRTEIYTSFRPTCRHPWHKTSLENIGDTDLNVLEVFATGDSQEISLNNWIRRIPPEMATAHLNLDADTISKIPSEALDVLPG